VNAVLVRWNTEGFSWADAGNRPAACTLPLFRCACAHWHRPLGRILQKFHPPIHSRTHLPGHLPARLQAPLDMLRTQDCVRFFASYTPVQQWADQFCAGASHSWRCRACMMIAKRLCTALAGLLQTCCFPADGCFKRCHVLLLRLPLFMPVLCMLRYLNPSPTPPSPFRLQGGPARARTPARETAVVPSSGGAKPPPRTCR